MRAVRWIAVASLATLAGGCSALRSGAVRGLAEAEVEHLRKLEAGLVAASGRKAVTASDGTTAVEVGLAKSLDQLVQAWNEQELTFTLWEQELSSLRSKAFAPAPVPAVGARGGDLGELSLLALGQQEEAAREASDFELACAAVQEAEARLTAGVAQMVAQAEDVHRYVRRSRLALAASSLDVAAVGAALGEFEEGRKLLAKAGELAPKLEKAAGKVGRAAGKVGLEGRADEIEVLLGILAERMGALGATSPAEDEEETP